ELPPEDLALGRSRPRAPRKGEPLRAEGLHRRGGRAGAPEGREEEADGLLDLLVGVEDHAVVRVVAEADGQRRLELAAARLVEDAAPQPRPEDMQLRLTHRALEAEQEPVVEVRRIVDAILVEDEGVRERADL